MLRIRFLNFANILRTSASPREICPGAYAPRLALKRIVIKRELLFKGVVEIEDVVEVVDVVAFGL